MWVFITNIILRNKRAILWIVGLITIFMGYTGSKIQLSYEFAKVLPNTDASLIEYEVFKKQFGEDGKVMFIGFESPDIFKLDKFNDWYALDHKIKTIKGIQDVTSIASIFNVVKNDTTGKFVFRTLVKKVPESQAELDSIKHIIYTLPFYEGLVLNRQTYATVMAVTLENQTLNSKDRIAIVNQIKADGDAFGKKYGIHMRYSGMPYIRTEYMNKVASETGLFIILGIIVTAIILYLFFHSFVSVAFSLGVVLIGVVWSLGFICLFGYRITILSGLIPSLILIIGVPNCIFLINKYHAEFAKHRNKVKAIARMIQTVGVQLFLANVTTAIGFGVFYFTHSQLLVEFGVVAALNVMVTYCLTLMLVSVILTYLPEPKPEEMRHLKRERITKFLQWIDKIAHNHRRWVYLTIGLATILFTIGMYKINVIGYVVDDLPQKHPIYNDLRFFEHHFKGVLPFEIAIDTKKPNGIFANNARTVYKIKNLQRLFSNYPDFSKPLSIVEAIRFFNQTYNGGDPKYYRVVPPPADLNKLSEMMPEQRNNSKGSRLQSFMDSTKQIVRVSYTMADIGSVRMKEIVKQIRPRIDSIFDPQQYDVRLTGHSLVFLKSNDYLLNNLFESLLIEIILITIVGIALFRSIGIILLSKLPCLIPLVITAGIMGFFNIYFKPSTILIFTIAFGISSDGTIYFLTKYRQELLIGRTISDAVSATIKETGISMIYTGIILFCGFAIFAASSFGGTVALGILVSITLLVSLCTNLILLPSILLSLEKIVGKNEITDKPLIDINDKEEQEEAAMGISSNL